MKNSLIALTVVSLALAGGCNNDGTGDGTAMTPADTSAASPAAPGNADATSPPATTFGDAEDGSAPGMQTGEPMDAAGDETGAGNPLALGLLAAIDAHEIAAANQAQAKGVTGAVLEYSNLMEKAHGDNLAKTRALGAAADTAEIQAMKAKGASELQALDAASGEEYEKAYIAAMVQGHQDALAKIDDEMIPAATTDAVKQHLAATRTHVAEHLAKARDIAAKQ
jgi:predicted outer membrane protein